MAPVYVLIASLVPHSGQAGLHAVTRRLVETTVHNGGIVRNVRNNGVRTMAYPFRSKALQKRFWKTHMFTMEFIAPPSAVKHLNSAMRSEMDVLRSTILRAEETLPKVRS